MYPQSIYDELSEVNLKLDQLLELLKTGRTKKVLNAKKIILKILAEEKVINRKALKERTGISDSELTRCLKELDEEGKIIRRVDTCDGRRIICVFIESLTELSKDEEKLLDLMHSHPELTFRELESAAKMPSKESFQAAYYKLLSLGLLANTEGEGRIYPVVTADGMRMLQREAVGCV